VIRSRLGVMMFLQYAIWGAWAPVLWRELTGLGFAQSEVGWIFSLLWLACMLAPLTGGQVADRWVATERVLGVAHLAGGILLLTLQRSPTRFSTWIVLMARTPSATRRRSR
jgi:MFS family permease